MNKGCEAYLLCDRCNDSTVLLPCPVPETATAVAPTAVTADDTALAANSLNTISGEVTTVTLPAAGAEGDVVTAVNTSLHSIALQNSAATSTLATLEPGGVVTYRYENANWITY